jgi:hypothetical protein
MDERCSRRSAAAGSARRERRAGETGAPDRGHPCSYFAIIKKEEEKPGLRGFPLEEELRGQGIFYDHA